MELILSTNVKEFTDEVNTRSVDDNDLRHGLEDNLFNWYQISHLVLRLLLIYIYFMTLSLYDQPAKSFFCPLLT